MIEDRRLLIAIGLVIISGSPAAAQQANRVAVEKAVRAQLREPNSARFTDVSFRTTANARGEPTDVACGKVVARTGAGGMSAAVPFVFFVRDRSVNFAENGIGVENDTMGMGAVVYGNFCLK